MAGSRDATTHRRMHFIGNLLGERVVPENANVWLYEHASA
jgi:hypothetical protein